MVPYKINVYEMSWNENNDTYIGSTKSRLSMRIAQHRGRAKHGGKERLYDAMRKYKDLELKYVLLEHYLVSSWDEQLKRERQWQDKKKPTLNMRIAYLHQEERFEKIKLSINCFCGGKFNPNLKSAKKLHFKSKIHQKSAKLMSDGFNALKDNLSAAPCIKE